jgi:hypothetical protein
LTIPEAGVTGLTAVVHSVLAAETVGFSIPHDPRDVCCHSATIEQTPTSIESVELFAELVGNGTEGTNPGGWPTNCGCCGGLVCCFWNVFPQRQQIKFARGASFDATTLAWQCGQMQRNARSAGIVAK